MPIERLHRFKNNGAEYRSYRGPELNLSSQSLMQGTKEATTSLLDLIDGKSQEHQQGQVRCQALSTMSVVMLEMVALVLKRVESLVLDFPARASTAHDLGAGALCQRKIGNPRPASYIAVFVGLLIKQVVN